MKQYDKILFAIALIACCTGVGIYLGITPSAKNHKLSENSLQGKTLSEWEDEAPCNQNITNWSTPDLDLTTGWNYDLFNAPEITWLTSESTYIAKELPPPADDPFGIKLISMNIPQFRLRISTVSSAVPPAPVRNEKGKIRGYRTLVKFENVNGGNARIDFSHLQKNKVEMKSEEKDGRTIITMDLAKPEPIPGQNAALKTFQIVKGKSDSGDGTSYTRYKASLIDRDDKNSKVDVFEEWTRKTNCLEALFQDTESTRQWLYKQKIVEGSDKPEVEILFRESANDNFKSIGNEAIFIKDDATYFVKGLDISSQEVSITKQSKSERKSKRPKLRHQILTPES